jgi:Arylsulfotransferase (ASST)
MNASPPPWLTRSQFLKAAGAAAAGLVPAAGDASRAVARPPQRLSDLAAGAAAGGGPLLSFHSRPDLRPPRVTVSRGRRTVVDSAGEYWFLTPGRGGGVQTGPLIVGEFGRLVWFRPAGQVTANLRVQRYRGKPVLTWWEGSVLDQGEGVIMDTSYREVRRVRAGNGRTMDVHEFLLTPEGTALVTCSPPVVSADLSSVGGSKDGQVLESIIQEIDLETGRVLLEWRSLEHVSVSESYMRAGGVYDFMHANSIDVTPDGNLLVSGRHTWALYKLERSTGRIIWRLGGKRSDFAMGPHAQFAWQHDARCRGAGTVTVFDDGAAFFFGAQPARATHQQSRGLVLDLDETHKVVRTARAYVHHPRLLAYAGGNMETMPDEDVVIGWGGLPIFSRLAPHGAVLAEAHLPPGYASYRAYQQPWTGTPAGPPALVASRAGSRHGSRLYASWNGATGVAAWRVSAGRDPGKLRPLGRVEAHSFETAMVIEATGGYAAVTALDGTGRALATSQPVKL